MVFKKIVALDTTSMVPPLTEKRFASVFHVLAEHNARAKYGVYPTPEDLYSDLFLHQRPPSPGDRRGYSRHKKHVDRSLGPFVSQDIATLVLFLQSPYLIKFDECLASITSSRLTMKEVAALKSNLSSLDPHFIKCLAMACLYTRIDQQNPDGSRTFDFYVPPFYIIDLCRITEPNQQLGSDKRRDIDWAFSTKLFESFYDHDYAVVDITSASYLPSSNNAAYMVLKLAEGLPFGCESHIYFNQSGLNIPPLEFSNKGVHPFALTDERNRPLFGHIGLLKQKSIWGDFLVSPSSDPGQHPDHSDTSKEDADAHYFLPSGLVELDK